MLYVSVAMILGACFAGCVVAKTEMRFVSPGGNMKTRATYDVDFYCKVFYNGTGPLLLKWRFLSDHVLISSNTDVLVGSSNASSRYSVEYNVYLDYYHSYKLFLDPVQLQDEGVYQCIAEANNVTIYQSTWLEVVTKQPEPTPPMPTAINFTDCCVSKNVSTECLSLCSSNTTDLNLFKTSQTCIDQALNILQCGSDGRNHINCCKRRGVGDDCLGLCQLWPGRNMSEPGSCLAPSAQSIMSCYAVGQVVLPSPPFELMAVPESTSAILVSWAKPRINGDTVIAYRLSYRQLGFKEFYSTDRIEASKASFSISSINGHRVKPDTSYELYMVAYNVHGSSGPTYHVIVTTFKPVLVYNHDIAGCCRRSEVVADCVSGMCSRNKPLTGTNAARCYTDLPGILNCYSGGANYSSCCRYIGIPDRCQSLCSGVQLHDWRQVDCLKYVEAARSCFMQASPDIPGPPTNVRLGSIGVNTQVRWDVPTKNPEKVTQYVVTYSPLIGGVPKRRITGALTVLLKNLLSQTKYWVQVSSQGVNGTSLPSNRIYFNTLTTDDADKWVPPTGVIPTEDKPRDLRACCVARGISGRCLDLCNLNLNPIAALLYLDCASKAKDVLLCASDGADHSPCCRRKGVSENCLPLCQAHKGTELGVSLLSCVAHISVGIQCLKEGRPVLPSFPLNLFVADRDHSSITIGWTKPVSTPAGVDGYTILVRKDDPMKNFTVKYNTSALINVTIYTRRVQKLEPDTRYYLSVAAYNSYGSSIMTPEVRVDTLPTNVPPPLNATNGSGIDNTRCCVKAGVQRQCLVYCNGNVAVPSTQCLSDVSKILPCVSGSANHSSCCSKSNVPSECLGFCDQRKAVNFSQQACLTHTPSVFTCLHVGAKMLPSPPSRFYATSGLKVIKLHWQEPLRNPQNVVYEVYVKKYLASYTDETVYTNITNRYLEIQHLDYKAKYAVYAIAVNSYGASLPTNTFYVTTLSNSKARVVKVGHRPDGVLREGDTVAFYCYAEGSPAPTYVWTDHNNKKVSNSSKYKIDKVDRRDRGFYECTATNSIGSSRLGSRLDILYKPIVRVSQSVVDIEPNRGRTVRLECFFEGNVTRTWWTRQNTIIVRSGKYSVRFVYDGVSVGTVAYLLIRNVTYVDFTMYTCYGNNSLGLAKADILVQELSNGLPTPPVTPSPLPPVPNVRDCCIKKKIPSKCLVACAFEIDLSQLPPDGLASCANVSTDIIQCQADGRDHSVCCRDAGVPSPCLNTCRGLGQPPLESAMLCASFTSVMIKCLQMGHEKIPSPPLHVNATMFYSPTRDSGLLVEWGYPSKNHGMVQNYHVLYQQTLSMETHEAVLKNDQFRYVISSHHLLANHVYKIWVKASNNYGSSADSEPVYATYRGVLPSVPRQLAARIFNYTNINVTWLPPAIPGHFDVRYQVFYRHINHNRLLMKGKFVQISTIKPYALLTNLLSNTTYEIYVQAVNVYGSGPSTYSIKLATFNKTLPGKTPSPQKGVALPVAIGVGVGVSTLVVIVIVVMVACYVTRIRRRTPVVKESVSFENQTYYSTNGAQHDPRVQISGLPSDDVYTEIHQSPPVANEVQIAGFVTGQSTDNNDHESQFKYQKLDEEQVHESPVYDNSEPSDVDFVHVDVQTKM